jgi:5-formyltetrahydrofolate cyclo-ligase
VSRELRQRIREDIRSKRRGLDPAWCARSSARIVERISRLPELLACRHLAGYLAMPGEVDVDRLLQRALAEGMRACVPAYDPAAGAYRLARYAGDVPVMRARLGVREPVCPRWVALEDVDVVLVPGVAFDPDCARLGHGAGYYDRLLAGPAGGSVLKVGVAFELQLVPRIPCEAWDVRMDMVVTEQQTLVRGGCPAGAEKGEQR